MTEKQKISADSTLAELTHDPKNQEILKKHQVPCLSCPLAGLEAPTMTLGQICEMYGLDIEKILAELNS